MSAGAEKTKSLAVDERDLVELTKLGLSADDVQTVKETVRVPGIKVELQVIFPAAETEIAVKAQQKQGRIGADAVIDRYAKLLRKAAGEALAEVTARYRADQSGDAKAYDAASSALSKFNKYAENLMSDFRVDLREGIAKRLGIGAKELMTVGRVSVKEWELRAGAFRSEAAIATKDDDDAGGEELKAALKFRDWQYVGLASSLELAKIIADRRKEITKAQLEAMESMFPKEQRSTLKFSRGRMRAKSETDVRFEFLKKTKVGKDPKTFEGRLKKGLREQTGKQVHLTIEPTTKYSADEPESSGPSKSKSSEET
mgnify:FL=1